MTENNGGFYQNYDYYLSRSSSNFETNLYMNEEQIHNSNQKNNFKKLNSSSKKHKVLDEKNHNNYYMLNSNEKHDTMNKLNSHRSTNKENKFDITHSGNKSNKMGGFEKFGDYFPINNKSEYYIASNKKQTLYQNNEDNISYQAQTYRSNANHSVKITDRCSLYNNDPTDTSYDSKNPSCSNAGYTNLNVSEKTEKNMLLKKGNGSPKQINRKINNHPTQNTGKKKRDSSMSSPRESHYPMSSYRNQQNFYYEEEEVAPFNNTMVMHNSIREDLTHKQFTQNSTRNTNQNHNMLSPKAFNNSYVVELDSDFTSYEED